MTYGLATSPAKRINELEPGEFLKLDRVIGGGSLEARKLATGATQFYWRYTAGGKTDRMPIGPYDPSAPPKSIEKRENGGYSVIAAMREAERLAAQNKDAEESGGLRAVKAAKEAARLDAQEQTLDKLMTDYCEYLKSLGRRSYRDAHSIFDNHVREPWPKKVRQPAASLDAEDFADMMRKVIEKGKGRTANKLRSYLRAAYQTAKAARTRPSIPVHFKHFGVTTNPVADTEPEQSANGADKNPLSADELRTYWRCIKDIEGVRGGALRLHLLTGGQRIEQLVNLLTAKIDADAFTIFDGKGRPGRPPRAHGVPLTKQAKSALSKCDPKGTYAISTDSGETHIAATTLSAWAEEAVGDLIPEFKAKRIRSGVETLLAKLGVSKDIRGRLQSHGVSGVQAVHYDAYDYMREKRDALALLEAELTRRVRATRRG